MTPHQHLFNAMRNFTYEMNRALNHVMKAQGASLAQIKLLAFIERGDLVRATDIGDAFGYAPRTVTMAIDGLERDGLVRRESVPNDRRAKQISLTDLGKQTLKDAEPARIAFTEKLFEVLDAADEEALLSMLEKLNGRLEVLRSNEEFLAMPSGVQTSRK